jgi:hypothetical protein
MDNRRDPPLPVHALADDFEDHCEHTISYEKCFLQEYVMKDGSNWIMNKRHVLLIVAIVLVTIASGTSFIGYNERTTIIPFLTVTKTSTNIMSTGMTETLTTSAYSTGFTFSQSILMSPAGDWYCEGPASGWVMFTTLYPGTLHVSFRSTAGVDFWILSGKQTIGGFSCENLMKYSPRTVSRTKGDYVIDIHATEDYLFLFRSRNYYLVTIDLTMVESFDSPQLVEVTNTVQTTLYSSTETVSTATSSRPLGLGPVFYSGLVIAAIGFGIAYVGLRRGKPRPPPRPTRRGRR